MSDNVRHLWHSPAAALVRLAFAAFGFWQTISGIPDVVREWQPVITQYDVVWRLAFLIIAFVLAGTLWREIEAFPSWVRQRVEDRQRSPLELVHRPATLGDDVVLSPSHASWGGKRLFDDHDLYRVAVSIRGTKSVDGVRVWVLEYGYWDENNADVFRQRISRPLRLYGDSAPYERSLSGVRIDPGEPRVFWDVVWRANNWKGVAELLLADALTSTTVDPKFGSVPGASIRAPCRVLLEATGEDVKPTQQWFSIGLTDMGLAFGNASGPPTRPPP